MFTDAELAVLVDALDSHMYWQLAEPNQRNDGFVNHDETDDNHEELVECEALIAKIEDLRRVSTV